MMKATLSGKKDPGGKERIGIIRGEWEQNG